MDKEALRQAMLQAQSMQHDLLKVQDDLSDLIIEAKSKDSKVKITMSAYGDFKKVDIDSSLMSGDKTYLEKSILDALNNAGREAAELTKTKLQMISKQIGL